MAELPARFDGHDARILRRGWIVGKLSSARQFRDLARTRSRYFSVISRDEALELLEPIDDDVNLARCLGGRLDHEETLAVGTDVIVG